MLKFLTDTRNSAALFILALVAIYTISPLLIHSLHEPNPYMVKLAGLTAVAAISIYVGFRIPILDSRFRPGAWRLEIDPRLFHLAVWIGFGIFAVVTLATADAIPLYSALQGQTTGPDLTLQRGNFLKMREGAEAALIYVSTLFTGTLLPYSLAHLFRHRLPYRYGAFAAFLLYAESFLQKALFIPAVTPLLYLTAQRKIWNYAALVVLIAGSIGFLYLNTVLARGIQPPDMFERAVAMRQEQLKEAEQQERQEEQEEQEQQEQEQLAGSQAQGPQETGEQPAAADEDEPQADPDEISRDRSRLVPPKFFTADFRPLSAREHMLWRMAAVPIFTASDALVVLDEDFDGRFLWGATSTFIAKAFGLERVRYDKAVFAHQWGRNEAGASNSVYVTEAFVNFGWIGVILFSLFIGQAFRWFWKSEDDAFKAMWPLFAFITIQAGLIGTLLSNGYALLLFLGLFIRVRANTVATMPIGPVSSASREV